jgi:hypothetical protein
VRIVKRFEENLEYLGFEMAPIAWDLAKFPFESDDDRITVLEELTAKEDTPSVNNRMVD